MDHLITCSCGIELKVSRSQAGQTIECECGKTIDLPTFRAFADLPVAGESKASSEPVSPWHGWRGPMMALFSAVFFIAGGMSLWFLLQSNAVNTSYTHESEIAAGNELLENYGPYELSLVWNDYESYGLGRKARPGFYLWNEFAKGRRSLSTTCGIVAGVFGVLALGVWLSARAHAASRRSSAAEPSGA